MSHHKIGHPFWIISGAVVLLVGLSLVPWDKITGGKMKSYNLFGDLFPTSTQAEATGDEPVDPELLAAMADVENGGKKGQLVIDPMSDTTIVRTERSNGITTTEVINPKPAVANTAADGTVVIEDYTVDNSGLKNFKRALAEIDSRPLRIAVIGDSYIEGDILTMDIREILQSKYGGSGVGYMPASSELTGFRVSVNQRCSGWTHHEIRKNCRENMKTLSGEYFTSGGNGKTTYKGVKNPEHLDSWNKSMVLAVAPKGGTLTLTTDAGTETVTLPAEDVIQSVVVDGPTTSASVSASSGVEVAGVYLNDNSGIVVDNMSLRGNSGITHRQLSVDRAAQMRPYVDYDMIIVEYGINALTSKQTNYDNYKTFMIQTISRLRECYPNADIVMFAIGERGQKSGSSVSSMPTSEYMVTAQRDAARQTGVLFWDTRKAMGGDGAVIQWREKGLISPDYIHLNRKGGKALAELFVNALTKSI